MDFWVRLSSFSESKQRTWRHLDGFHRSILAADQWWRMTRGGNLEAPRSRLINAEADRHKLTFRILLGDGVVQVAQDQGRVTLGFRQIAQERADHAHKQRSRDSLATHVGDREGEPV